MDEKIKVAMVTGHHEYDVVDFQQMLRAIPDVDFYPQHLEDFALDTEEARSAYDVLAFYNFQQDLLTERDAFDRDLRRPLAELGDHGQGIFMLHHALTAFPGWLHWQEICGIGDTTKPKSLATAKIDQDLTIEIADAEHPITKGLSSWQMIDEVYLCPEASPDSHVLLTIDHPGAMSTIAWTRNYRNSRVFCLQSGHDNQTFANAGFRTMIERGVKWLAGRI